MLKFANFLLFLVISLYVSATYGGIYYAGEVKGIQGTVFGTPEGGHSVTTLPTGFPIRVYKKRGSRYLVGFTRNMENIEGWMETDQVTVDPHPRTEATTAAPPPEEQKAKQKEEKSKSSIPPRQKKQEARLFVGPVYDIHNFGTTQFRMGASYEHRFWKGVAIGLPVEYSMGGGFHDFGLGIETLFDVAEWDMATLVIRGATMFERFAGNGKSFVAATFDVGGGFRFPIGETFFIDAELASFQVTPFATKGLPLFVRGQALFALGGKW